MDELLANRLRRTRATAGNNKTAATHAFGFIHAEDLDKFTISHMQKHHKRCTRNSILRWHTRCAQNGKIALTSPLTPASTAQSR